MRIEDILEEKFKEADLFLNEEMEKYAGEVLIKKMVKVFENKQSARDWFYSPSLSLEGKRPYDYCKNGKIGIVRKLLERTNCGIFS